MNVSITISIKKSRRELSIDIVVDEGIIKVSELRSSRFTLWDYPKQGLVFTVSTAKRAGVRGQPVNWQVSDIRQFEILPQEKRSKNTLRLGFIRPPG